MKTRSLFAMVASLISSATGISNHCNSGSIDPLTITQQLHNLKHGHGTITK
ncbi:hypothetical protein B5T_00377 [Alloalcanivorax dieselolei B5]|uniref:Uncharacterized protein n=1 Tax=Alcanivorax dieselolei (strain DSM 16502 / CGMCC 1.3690 / MCCC 1A00001 / B-5) TaxID=930169 RepID=K0C5G3_ALCDB|nr:hypothetical protein B5T_00377 [Alloalcanivorax dieselolei B5]